MPGRGGARRSPEVGARLTRTDGLVVAVAPEATTSAVDECDNAFVVVGSHG